jgi:hypothetical protein
VPKIGAIIIPTTTAGPQAPTAVGTVSSPLLPNSGANGLPLTATTSGVSAVTTTGAIATPSGTAVLGATGRDMPECLAAWDTKTHITKSRWREICKSTLVEPDL